MKTLQALFIAALLGASSLAGAAKGQLNHSIDDGTYFGIDYYTPVIGESPTPAWTTTYFAGNAKGQCRLYGIRVWFKNMN
jgi:hypothetical protein